MDYVWFTLIVLALIGGLYVINRFDRRARDQYRAEAYRVLDLPDPSSKELENAIKGLRFYGGRIRKNKEFADLKDRLAKRLNAIER